MTQSHYTILLAEDDAANRDLVSFILEKAGHKVVPVMDGIEALQALEAQSFDICIVDMQMPRMNGLETMTQFRVKHAQNNMPFIMLTGDETDETRQVAEKAGVNVLLTKPVRGAMLRDVVSNVAGKQGTVLNKQHDHDTTTSPGILEYAHLDYMTDKKFLEGIYDIFLDSSEKLMQQLHASIKDNYQDYANIMHTLKGLSGSIGAQKLRDIITEMEHMQPVDSSEKIESYLPKLEQAMNDTRQALYKHCQQHG